MTAPAASADDLTLDACAALRADLAAQPGAGGAAAGAAPGAWLLLVTSLERAGQLPTPRRAAHFRQARAVWDEAAALTGEARYAAVGARLGRWRTADPTLPVVKELLWAVEQPEAAGYTRLAVAGCAAVGRLVPADDARHGYVLAQSARAVRTLGDLEGARERYELSARLGARHRDRWLRVRSAIGLGATYHQAGNHPAARAVFRRVLDEGSPDPRFTAAAHQGLLHSANASGDDAAALEHAWHLLRASRDGVLPKLDAWLMMAAVCVRLSRYRAATHLAEASLRHATRPDDTAVSLQILMQVAAATADTRMGSGYAPALRACVGGGVSVYDDVRSLLALADYEHVAGERDAAREDLERARGLAARLGLHELVYRADQTSASWSAERQDESSRTRPPLSRHEARILQRVTAWDCTIDADAGTEVPS